MHAYNKLAHTFATQLEDRHLLDLPWEDLLWLRFPEIDLGQGVNSFDQIGAAGLSTTSSESSSYTTTI